MAHDVEGTGQHFCATLTPQSRPNNVFRENASPKPLDVATSIFADA